jgi:signal transduction histidine kinase
VRNGETRGVGLGLYLVKQMMETMGGSVSVSSQLQRGTVFVLHFPVSNLGTERDEPVGQPEAPARFAPR